MKYIDLIKNFWQLHDVEVFPANSIALYFYLLEVNNKLLWKTSFKRNNSKICADLGMSKPTLNKSRNRLKQAGLIDFKTKNGDANVSYTCKRTFKNILQGSSQVRNVGSIEGSNEVSFSSIYGKERLRQRLRQRLFILKKKNKKNKKIEDDSEIKKEIKNSPNSVSGLLPVSDEGEKRKKVAQKKEKTTNEHAKQERKVKAFEPELPFKPKLPIEPERLKMPKDFEPIWEEWLEYRKSLKKKYSGIKWEQIAVNRLIKYSNGNAETARKIVNNSITNSWIGFFELRTKNDYEDKNHTQARTNENTNRRVAKINPEELVRELAKDAEMGNML